MKFASTNTCLITALLLTMVSYAGIACACDLDETKLRTLGTSINNNEDFVSTDELSEWIMQGKQDYTLVDIRSSDEYQTSHIQGAVNIPVIRLFSSESIDQLPADKLIIVYSNASMRAAQAAVMLRLSGLDAYTLLGGYEHWVMHTLNPEAASAQDPNRDQLDDARRDAIARALKNCETPCVGSTQGYVPPLTPVIESAPPPPASSGGGVLLDEGC